ncbi:hypothetical protein [Streptomyces sp. CBMA123]|uniref:hypothetical protein n=1 Tax=Streptomyces sp. CBMA123 TaxID=1896313 RepID=UPI001661AD1D|nr:hypothetical protein [Streptomyces sp. CBMA123]MBD0692776.1 hypothetical protein [Streptomyces sp. CBMA123]
MTTAAGAPPTHRTSADLALGFLTGGVIGASPAAFIGGCAVGRAPLIVLGLALPTAYGLVLLLATRPRRAREAAVVPRTALGLIEGLEAVGSEGSDVPVRFELTVAPDGEPAFRVEIRQDVNLVELSDFRPRGVVVVEYPPDRPWKGRIVRRPTPEWEERAAGACLDSAPGPAMKSESPKGCAGGLLTLLGLLLGATAVLVPFRADLFDSRDGGSREGGGAPGASVTSSTTSFSSVTSVTSATGTVTLGPGRSMLDQGELRRAVESLTQDADQRQALTVLVQDHQLTVVFRPAGVPGPGFDPRSLPYDRVPALVEQAGAGLGGGSPRSWQLTADGVVGPLTLRVVVTGDGGSATLEADGRGDVLRRSGG